MQIVLKTCREAYCHYCLNELPVDTVPCISCSISLYCSQHCQLLATGETISYFKTKEGIDESLPNNVKEHIADVISSSDSKVHVECFFEHKHECRGVHWPAVLPSDVVLAGRIIAKAIFERRNSMESNLLGTLVCLKQHIVCVLYTLVVNLWVNFKAMACGFTLFQKRVCGIFFFSKKHIFTF